MEGLELFSMCKKWEVLIKVGESFKESNYLQFKYRNFFCQRMECGNPGNNKKEQNVIIFKQL